MSPSGSRRARSRLGAHSSAARVFSLIGLAGFALFATPAIREQPGRIVDLTHAFDSVKDPISLSRFTTRKIPTNEKDTPTLMRSAGRESYPD